MQSNRKGACQARKQAAPAILLSVLTILALALPLVAATSSMYERLAARVGTIPWLKTQQPGAVITLDAMMVDEIGDGFLIVKEPCLITEKVRVQAYARVEKWRSVEVTGTIALDDESGMYIKDARVYVYADSKGHIMPIVPKSIQAPRDYWTKIDVTLSGPDPTPPTKERTQPPMMMDSMVGFNPDVTPIAAIKLLPDGTTVEVRNKWVSSVWWWGDSENVSYPTFWVEEADRSAGIKVIGDQFGQDSLASFTATLDTMDGQRVLKDVANVSDIWPPSNFMPPPSLGMPCKTVGGPPLNGAHKFSGLDNTARLVTTWGNVVSCAWGQTGGGQWVDYVNIDDGSGVPMRVEVPETVQPYSGMIRVTGISDTIRRSNDMYNVNYDPLPDLLEDYVRRIVCRNYNDVVTPGGAPGPPQQGTASGHLIANEIPSDPVLVYTANGWVKALPSQWQLVGSQYKAPYSVSGVPGNANKVGLISAKGLGYATGYAFANPGSANVDISLTDTSVRRLDLADPNPAIIGCGISSQITAHFWDAEGYDYVARPVVFTATNGVFTGGLNQVTIDTDTSGLASVTVSATNGSNVTVTASALGIQSQKTVPVSKEMMVVWSVPALDDPSGQATVYAKLLQPDGVTPVSGMNIAFTPTGGTVNPTSAITNEQGTAQTTFTRTTGNPSVTASWSNACGFIISASIGVGPDWEWPMFHKDIAHTGVANTALSANLAMKWNVQLNGNFNTMDEKTWSSPVVAGNVVYVGTNTGWLYAYDAINGTKLAETNLGSPIHGTPCVDNALIYVGTQNGGPNDEGELRVFSLNVQGQAFVQQWEYVCPSGQVIWGSPVVYNGAVYFGTTREYFQPGWLHTVDLSTHLDRAGSPATMIYGAIGVAPGIDVDYRRADGTPEPRAYISDYSCWVTAIKCQTGAKAWNDDWSADNVSMFASPVTYQGFVFVGSDANRIYKLKDDGDTIPGTPPSDDAWLLPTGGAVQSTPAAWNGKLYFGCNDRLVYSVDASAFTSPVYSDDLGSQIISSPAISTATGQIFVATLAGRIYALDINNLANETLVYDAQKEIRSSPALANGHMYIVAGDSNYRYLYCFGN